MGLLKIKRIGLNVVTIFRIYLPMLIFPIKVLFQEDLADVLSRYHCLFLPTLSESFGHVIVECMLAGIVVISDQHLGGIFRSLPLVLIHRSLLQSLLLITFFTYVPLIRRNSSLSNSVRSGFKKGSILLRLRLNMYPFSALIDAFDVIS